MNLHTLSGTAKDPDGTSGLLKKVHRAKCLTNGAEVAMKLMNLESMNCELEEIINEAHIMRKYNHPNILPLYCSFVHGQELWMVMPFVAGGSVLHIMKYAHPEGLDEVIIATIAREVLKGLDYVHKNGSIHRDVKAGNILVDGEGNVKLGDFGVTASMERGGSWGHDKQARMTFVGTPCWMAPEVMEQTSGYDFSADIWSFGITLLEMCHGHAPFAKFPPMKVLLMTLQNPAPTLEDKGKRHFSKGLKDLVTRCLQKEKDKRPTAAQLLEHKFLKNARDAKFLKEVLLGGLPALSERVNQIRMGVAATNKQDNDRNLEKSQEEYRKGVSAWNFDLAELKKQAALEPDDESTHGANMLPTISESDEREDTLMGTSADATERFMEALATAAAAEAAGSQPLTSKSVFATPSGQDATVKTNAVFPVITTAASTASDGEASGAAPERSTTPGEMPPPSPGGGVSPAAGLSREGSFGGTTNTGVTAGTPTGNAAVTKLRKGRFEVCEHAPAVPASTLPPAAPAPPAPPPAPVPILAPAPVPAPAASAPSSVAPHISLATVSSSGALNSLPTGSGPSISGGTVPDLSALRGSNLGLDTMEARGDEGLPTAKTEVEESVTSVEPKQRGRFKIVAEQGGESRPLSKASSMANLTDVKAKLPVDSTSSTLGKPPTAPTFAVPPVNVVLPKLQELLDHSAAHQAAIQRLIGAVQECDKGRLPLLLSRTQSTKSLFDVKDAAGPADGIEELRQQLAELRSKVSTLEEENLKLRDRNKVLETLHSAPGGWRFTGDGRVVLISQEVEANSPGATAPTVVLPAVF